MKKLMLVIAVAALSVATSNVSATFGGDKTYNTNSNINKPTQNQGQAQGQAQGQLQGQGQAQGQMSINKNNIGVGQQQSATVHGSSSSSSSSVTFNTPAEQRIQYSGEYEVKGVPDAYAPQVYPTAPCMGSTSIGGSGVGFGFSAGTTWEDKDCTIRETARSFANMGMHDDAVAVLCSSEAAQAAPSCKSSVSQETTTTKCYSDELVASRMNAPVCQ